MESTIFIGISAFLSTLLVIVNLYNTVIKKPREAQESNLKETDKALNEFIVTYSGQYSALRTEVDHLRRNNDDIYRELDLHRRAIDEVARQLFVHEKVADKKEEVK